MLKFVFHKKEENVYPLGKYGEDQYIEVDDQ